MTDRPGAVLVHVALRTGDTIIPGEWVSTIEAIHRLQEAIRQLRQTAMSAFDPSFGEQPPALLAPSEEEVAASIA